MHIKKKSSFLWLKQGNSWRLSGVKRKTERPIYRTTFLQVHIGKAGKVKAKFTLEKYCQYKNNLIGVLIIIHSIVDHKVLSSDDQDIDITTPDKSQIVLRRADIS